MPVFRQYYCCLPKFLQDTIILQLELMLLLVIKSRLYPYLNFVNINQEHKKASEVPNKHEEMKLMRIRGR